MYVAPFSTREASFATRPVCIPATKQAQALLLRPSRRPSRLVSSDRKVEEAGKGPGRRVRIKRAFGSLPSKHVMLDGVSHSSL